ncbi:MAG: biotin--[acetyl-CoA-carboxylase] ligase [Oscillospiraceae bacterium]|jgi:BirA family biotin operon repressor/biotin-[acetyl-CoA-carboxylase] ligase|nr:biotin--[acetyl-CoA-carboxylase] ligase [Oscillospiraceae bacterium]
MIQLEYVARISSTADVMLVRARHEDVAHATLLVAGEQTAGHGRGGAEKPFFSPLGGLYMSLLLRDVAGNPAGTLPITPRAALAVRRVLARHGCSVGIKWVNDIYIGAKKAGGILTQLLGNCAIVSCGLNLWRTAPAPEGLSELITYCYDCEVDSPEPRSLAVEIAEELLSICGEGSNAALLEEYRAASVVLGKNVTYWQNGTLIQARAIDITDEGSLMVRQHTGEARVLNSGEVRLRLE